MKRLLSLVLCAALLFSCCPVIPLQASAATSGTCGDNLTWTLDDEDTLTISGTGAMRNYTATATAPWYYLRTSIKSVVIETGVTSIGDYAFYSCSSMTEISIPEGVTQIGSYAFRFCTALTSVTTPDTVTAFGSYTFHSSGLISATILSAQSMGNYVLSSCPKLETVVLGDLVTTLGDYTFSQCTSLRNLHVGNSLTSLGDYSFAKCTALENVYISNLTDWSEMTTLSGHSGNCGDYSVFYTSNHPMCYAKNLYLNGELITDLKIPDGVAEIGDSAFCSCDNLESVKMADSVTKIGFTSFAFCYALERITISKNIRVIQHDAFADCTALTEVYFKGDAPTSIVDTAFIGVTATVYYPAGNNTWTTNNKRNYGGNLTWVPYEYTEEPEQEPEELPYDGLLYKTINNKTVTITGYAGEKTELIVPDTIEGLPVTKIDTNAFLGCDWLVSVEIPDSVLQIMQGAFSGCSALERMTIPFIGPHRTTKKASNQYPFGYIFGCNSYTGGKRTDQSYYYAPQRIRHANYYIPQTLRSVTVTGGYIPYGTFSNCTGITEIVLGDNVTGMYGDAFIGSGLQNLTIGAGISILELWTFSVSKKLSNIIFTGDAPIFNSHVFGNQSRDFFTNITADAYYPGSNETWTEDVRQNYGGNITWIPYGEETTPDVEAPDTSEPEEPASENQIMDGMAYTVSDEEVTIIGYIGTATELVIPDTIHGYPVTGIGSAVFTGMKTVGIPESITSIQPDSFGTDTLLQVYENSYAHIFAEDNDLNYTLIGQPENPELLYGTSISGTVTYQSSSPAIGVSVDILYDDGSVKETVVTDENGNYKITFAEVNNYTLRVIDSQGNIALSPIQVIRINTQDVFVEGDTNFILKSYHAVSGCVNLYPATVTVTDLEGKIFSYTESPDGNFRFDNIPNGTFIVTAVHTTGTVSQEITVFDADVSDVTLEIEATAATLWGCVEVEDRHGMSYPRNWVQVSIYNAAGTVVAQTRSDIDGIYTFSNLPAGQYAIVAETAEMRPDKNHSFDRSHTLTGYAYVEVTEITEYQVDTIVLREKTDSLATVSGKVTANGETQDCEVVLRDVFRHEIAKYSTKKNGKYSFKNVCDGLYYIIATTKSDGMGYVVVTVLDGKVYGATNIKVAKADKIAAREAKFAVDVPDCADRAEAMSHSTRIAEEKQFYDSLSEKEKKQLSASYVERLNRYIEWIANCQYETTAGVSVEQGGLVISAEELANKDEITFNLSVEKTDPWVANTDGVHDGNDYLYHDAKDTAGHRNTAQYYEITMTKTVDGKEVPITSVQKDTDTTGKLRITLPIPEEYQGHKHYSLLHIHEGEPVLLTDLDNDPDTVTVEVDKFSIFVLLETDRDAIEEIQEDVVEDSLSDAITASTAGSHLKLQQDLTENVTVDKTIYLDLNGFSIHGTVTAAEGTTLYVKDSQTDDYTIEDENVYGKITGTVNGVEAQDGYMMITEEDGVSFHRLTLQLTSMALRAADTGIYFKSDFAGDELVAQNVKQFGVALSVQGIPTADNLETDCKYSAFIGFKAGKQDADATSTLLKGIMKSENASLVNYRNANMPIYGRAYILTNEGEYIFGAAACRTFKEQVEAIDTMWSKLSATQQTSLVKMYEEFSRVMGSWNLPNLKEYIK